MGARINVEISKPNENYQYTSGDLNQIADKIVEQLTKEDSTQLAINLCKILKIDVKEKT